MVEFEFWFVSLVVEVIVKIVYVVNVGVGNVEVFGDCVCGVVVDIVKFFLCVV